MFFVVVFGITFFVIPFGGLTDLAGQRVFTGDIGGGKGLSDLTARERERVLRAGVPTFVTLLAFGLVFGAVFLGGIIARE